MRAHRRARELAGRLNAARDRYSMRGGESLWGAYRSRLIPELNALLGEESAALLPTPPRPEGAPPSSREPRGE